jgi:hypothetical protein
LLHASPFGQSLSRLHSTQTLLLHTGVGSLQSELLEQLATQAWLLHVSPLAQSLERLHWTQVLLLQTGVGSLQSELLRQPLIVPVHW